jgi:hypothetical protein
MTRPAPEHLALVTSPDGQWTVAREHHALVLMPGAGGAPVGTIELPTTDVDIALVGPPTALVVLSRTGGTASVVLYTTPQLEAAARLDLDTPARIATSSGPRLAVVSADNKNVTLVRSAGRALATQKIELAAPLEFIVGLERNQVLVGMPRKLEVWDAASGRPLLRAQFQLPPPPRVLGAAAGHLWAMTTGSEEIFLYRLSDGRPFRHVAGAPISEVISHPSSPLVVLVTPQGLVRLHCYAHSLVPITGVPDRRGVLAQHVSGDDVALVGFTGLGSEPWRLPINGAGVAPPVATGGPVVVSVAPTTSVASFTAAARTTNQLASRWREPLAAYGEELAKGADAELPVVAIDTELGDLAHRLELSPPARHALIALYALHLVGSPALSIAALARVTGEWAEALGQGELGALAMLRRKHGKVSLRTAVTDILDGVAPRSIRIVGGGAGEPRPGAFRVSRDSRSDAEIESALAAQLGRIAIVEGPMRAALLEARLHGATAIAYSVPPDRPRPWPRDAGLVLVLYGTTSSWVADVPALPTEPT